jgi:hypothetical protein
MKMSGREAKKKKEASAGKTRSFWAIPVLI